MLMGLLLMPLQAELDVDFESDEWRERKASFNKESWQSQIWTRFPNAVLTGSTPVRGNHFAAAASSPSFAGHGQASAGASMAQLVSVLRNIHGELAGIHLAHRAISNMMTTAGVTRDRLKESLEVLLNGSAQDGEAGQSKHAGSHGSALAPSPRGSWFESAVHHALIARTAGALSFCCCRRRSGGREERARSSSRCCREAGCCYNFQEAQTHGDRVVIELLRLLR